MNQDKLRSRGNCEVRARELLLQGQRVIIDRCGVSNLEYSRLTRKIPIKPPPPRKKIKVRSARFNLTTHGMDSIRSGSLRLRSRFPDDHLLDSP